MHTPLPNPIAFDVAEDRYDPSLPVFFDAPSVQPDSVLDFGEEILTRFAGTIHIRGQPPYLESENSPNNEGKLKEFDKFFKELTEGQVAKNFWDCVMQTVWLTDQSMMQAYNQEALGANKLQAENRPQVGV